jgi:HlyD family secretion protein/epimerase transport system membrane fusion protein
VNAPQTDRVVQMPGRGSAPQGPKPLARPLGNWRGPAFAAAIIITLTFGGAGLWAATAPLDSAVVAPGTIAVESSRKVVQHVDGGSVIAVLVNEGDRVDTGDLLVRLDPTEKRAAVERLRGQLAGARARRARLIAERDGATGITFPEDLRDRQAYAPPVAEAIAGERNQFLERRQSLAGQVAILERRIAGQRNRIAGLREQRNSVVRQVGIMRDELSGLRELMEKGYYPRIRVLQRERELANLEGRSGELRARIAEARDAIEEAELEIRQVQQGFREEVVARLRETEVQIGDLRERLTAAEAALVRTTVRSPHPGTVHALQVKATGAVVRPGGEILQLVPQDDQLVVEARVPPQDIDLVQPGMTAEVRMTALASTRTPTLEGTIQRVSPDRLVSENGEQAYYSARITIPASELQRLGDQRLQAGMPAEVMVATGERTLVDYLTKPLTDAMARGLIEN